MTMLIKSLVTGAALALAVSVGSASAAEDFSTTSAVPAEPLTASEMAAEDFATIRGVAAAPLTASEMAAVVGAYIANARPRAHGAPFNVLAFQCGHTGSHKNPGGQTHPYHSLFR